MKGRLGLLSNRFKLSSPPPALHLTEQKEEESKQKEEAKRETASINPPENYSSTSTDNIPDSPLTSRSFWLGFRTGYSGSTMSSPSNGSGSVGLSSQYQFSHLIGVEAGADLGFRSDTYSNGGLDTVKYNLVAGLPLNVLWWAHDKERLFIQPGYFYMMNKYSFTPSSGTSVSSSQNQSGWLAVLGVDFYTILAGSTPTFIRATLGMGSPSGSTGVTASQFFTGSLGFSYGIGSEK